jgi:Trk K+ transport system NAD-binding subunit
MEQPFILCGLGRVGSRVLQYLQSTGLPVVVIDSVCKPDDPRLLGFRLIQGDCRRREVLESAGAANARGVLVVTGDDLINLAATLMIRGLNPDVRIVLRMFNQNLIGRLGKTVHNVYALSTSLLTAPILAMTALTGQELGRFHIEGIKNQRRHVAELQIGPGSEFAGKAISAVLQSRDIHALAHLPASGKQRYLVDLPADTLLQEGDRLVVCGEPTVLNELMAAGGLHDDADLRWAGLVRRIGRMVWRTLSQMDLAVKLCGTVLLTVVTVGVVVLRWNLGFSVPTALFRTISIIATGSDLREDSYAQLEGLKVFISMLRIVGAVLTGAFTAIVTNYLIRARLAGALEVRRIPDRGHVVIVGLAPIGFRVMEELLDCKTQVVVIERNPDNRFVVTARRSGAAVIVGDATFTEVLRHAHAATARAVIAATNHDLVNLEVALLVRDLNPVQRVVLLQGDPQLAQMLREAANVQLAVSVPALAAPAFVASLFGDRVLSVFLVGGQLLVVIDLVVGEKGSLLHGKTMQEAAKAFRIQPIAVIPPSGDPTTKLMETELVPGNRLIGIIALPDLELLLQRQPRKASDSATG